MIPIQPHVQDTKPIPPVTPTAEAAAPVQPEAEPDPEQDLDALLNEIREMIANSPVPVLEEEEEPAPSVEEVSEPTLVRTVYTPAAKSAPEEPAEEEDATRPWKAEEIPQAPEEAEEEEADIPEDAEDPDEELLE